MSVERYKLTFSDGTTREVERRPIHYIRAEGLVGGNAGTMTYVYATLWAADTGGRGDRKAFEAWMNEVDDFDPVEVTAPKGADAGPPDPSPGT